MRIGARPTVVTRGEFQPARVTVGKVNAWRMLFDVAPGDLVALEARRVNRWSYLLLNHPVR